MSSFASSQSSTIHDEDSDAPTSKRPRHSRQPKPKRKPMSLAGIIHVPMDIFAEIASYLYPHDILSLARTTKHYRTLLMQRSAKHIWSASERNIPGLPPCPEHLDEPEYASLVFGKSCSQCAANVGTTRRMDAVLCVKLCNVCRERMIVGSSTVPTPAHHLVLFSQSIKPPTHLNPGYTLINSVNTVTTAMYLHANTGDTAGFQRWQQQRQAALAKQREFANALGPFLDSMDEKRDDEVEDIKAKRFVAIKERLMQIGWEEVDCHVTHYPLLREWQKLVAQPKPLTNRIWDNILPKLVPILTTNRQQRLIRERKERARDRVVRMHGLLTELEDSMRPVIEFQGEGSEGPTTTAALPFPNRRAALKLPVVRGLLKEDVSGDAVAEMFGAKREDVVRGVRNWRYRLEEELGQMIYRAGEGYAGLLGVTRYAWEGVSRWDLTSTTFTPDSLEHINPATQKALRADSVFEIGKPKEFNWSPVCHFYPDVIHLHQAQLEQQHSIDVQNTADSDVEDGYESDVKHKPLNLSGISGHAPGKRAAKRLLRCLGKPHAAYLEMKAIGQRFVCERCWVKKPMGWAEIVEHYANSQYSSNTTKHWFAHQGIKFNNEHDTAEDKISHETASAIEKDEAWTARRRRYPGIGTVSPPGAEKAESQSGTSIPTEKNTGTETTVTEPESVTKPLVRILSLEEAESALKDESGEVVRCGICEAVAEGDDGSGPSAPMPRPEGLREVIVRHLIDVHELPEEKWEMVLKTGGDTHTTE
ncbi:hypothetical protein RhiJN_00626 [Ceratobasidium sp. AG-Ba]|nr:hypothetical protein RhiJN_00626 [Ceratobasidium sp. AG-Ba]